MEEPPCSSSSRSSSKGKSSIDPITGINVLSDDLLHNIFTRLPAISFASATCVNKSWNSVCNRIISRPKLASALSLNPSLRDAVNEVVDKVLSEPIRPYFAIVNIGCGFDQNKILRLVKRRVGFNIPVVVTVNNGIIGRDAVTDEFKEVKWGALFSGIDDEEYARHINEGIVLTIGCLPGLKVEAIPLIRPAKTPQEPCVDSFSMDIKEYSASVSGHQFPVGIILFGEASSDMKLVMEKLDYAMPMDTVVVGDERGCSVFRCGNDSRHACGSKGCIEAVALVFAQDRNRSSGNIRFHVAFSNGVSPVGGRYKAASVRTNKSDCSTWLTAKREGHQQPLDGQTILHDINTLLENHIEPPELYIGVTKHRKVSIGAEKPMPRTCIAYHGVVGGLTGERTVKSLRLSKALTVPETTTVYEACRRMAARRVDALLLTDSNGLLCGILTDKDIATKVVAEEINPEDTPVSKVMTRNPVFVLSETLAVEALQKMVQGKFRHLPVVENGEVLALLDIAKCLHDATARMERAAEKGKAIAAAVEGVEKHWGSSNSDSNSSFVEALREKIFKPSLSTIIHENSKMVTVAPTDSILKTTKKMVELHAGCAVVTVDGKPRGIVTSRDILMRVIAQNLPPASTHVEKVMTPNPECVIIDTPIVDALHTMHDGKFLHLPVVDRDGIVVAVVDVIHVTHAAVATVSQVGNNEASTTLMQRFWDSAMALPPNDDDDETRSESSFKIGSDGGETGRSIPYISASMPNTFSFKVQDKKGRMHRFTCDTRSMTEVISSILQRLGTDIDPNNLPHILYEDEDHDKVVLASDSDLAAAVDHARTVGLKGLKLYLDYEGTRGHRKGSRSGSLEHAYSDAWASAYSGVAAGAALVAGLGLLTYLKRV